MKGNNIAHKVRPEQCTGCSACANCCPAGAIVMEPDKDGFEMPRVDEDKCLDCGRCIEICPTLHFPNENFTQPTRYLFREVPEILKISSSGGFITWLARHTFSQGGFVCGAVFDPDWSVRLVIAHNEAEFGPMHASKYVYSSPGLIYREIGGLLEHGTRVMFAGMPCQVAGLRNYLGKTWNNLLCVDLLCRGFAPQRIFKAFLEETAGGRTITGVRFRDKTLGWYNHMMRIEFSDGQEWIGDSNAAPYQRVVHPNQYIRGYKSRLFLRESCANCPFCAFPRTGDFSSGDFWGYDRIFPELKSPLGTSLVLVNNNKASHIIGSLPKENVTLVPVASDAPIINRLHAVEPPNPNRARFLDLAAYLPVTKAIGQSLDKHYDIGCVSIYSVPNFGGALTYYALYHVLRDLGYSTLMIERPKSSRHKPASLLNIYEPGAFPAWDLAPIFPNRRAMRALNPLCDTFLVGSDQLYNNSLYHLFDEFASLDWVQDNKKKIAYAASFGKEFIWSPEDVRAKMAYFLKKFDAFSVREKSGVPLCREEFGIEAVHVLDPVFLVDRKHYDALADMSAKQNQPKDTFLAAYILDPTTDKQKVIEDICIKNSLTHRIYTEYGLKKPFYLPIMQEKLNKQLMDLRDCKFCVTDSFHGVCFSLIFRKNFIVFDNEFRGNARFESILGMTGLKYRLISSLAEFEEKRDILLSPIDYDIVYQKLGPEIERCRNWLKAQLEKKVSKSFSDYDIFVSMLEESDKRINVKNLDTDKKILRIAKFMNNELLVINNIETYLNLLYENLDDYIILIAVKDTPGFEISEATVNAMHKLGLQVDLRGKHWKGYLAILNGRELIQEQLSYDKETLFYDSIFSFYSIAITSSPFPTDNVARIMVNKIDFSINRRGLNFVIIGKDTNKVLDSVCFDTHVPGNPASRDKLN